LSPFSFGVFSVEFVCSFVFIFLHVVVLWVGLGRRPATLGNPLEKSLVHYASITQQSRGDCVILVFLI
jgi:hypothetical protein